MFSAYNAPRQTNIKYCFLEKMCAVQRIYSALYSVSQCSLCKGMHVGKIQRGKNDESNKERILLGLCICSNALDLQQQEVIVGCVGRLGWPKRNCGFFNLLTLWYWAIREINLFSLNIIYNQTFQLIYDTKKLLKVVILKFQHLCLIRLASVCIRSS